jgi:tRNA U34 2-thiouridine synthase MnmA/TrmU
MGHPGFPVHNPNEESHGENSYPATITHPTTGVEASSKNHQVQIQGSDQGFAAGQFAVFYSGEVCLGCATIC